MSNFSDGDWYGGISITSPPAMNFLSWLRPENLCGPAHCRPSALRWQSPCLIAFLVCMILKGQMKSVRKGVDANVYTHGGRWIEADGQL